MGRLSAVRSLPVPPVALLAAFVLAGLGTTTFAGAGTYLDPGVVEPLQDEVPPPEETTPPEDPEELQDEAEAAAAEESAVDPTESAEVSEEAPAELSEAGGYGADATGENGAKVSGFLNLRYRGRWASDNDDHDLYGVGAVDIVTGGRNPWKFHLLGRGAWDMDGDSNPDPFYSVDDSWNSSVTGRLYYAWADAPVSALDVARIGRQVIHETPVVAYFDGARLEVSESSPMGLMFGAYGGVSSRLFETSPRGDWTGGAYTSLNPWSGGRLRFDYLHLQDETSTTTHQDDLLALGLRHSFSRDLDLEGKYSWLEGEERDLTLRGNWFYPSEEFSARISYYRLFQAQGDLSLELNPFFNSLRTLYPYQQTMMQLSKGVGGWGEILGGADIRRVDDESDIAKFNRDVDRYYLTLALLELLPLDTTVSFRGELWDSPSNDISTWGLDLDSVLGAGFTSRLGTYYSLYKTYLDIDVERQEVRTYYVELRKELFTDTDWDVRYEYEDAEFDNYNTLRIGMTWRF